MRHCVNGDAVLGQSTFFTRVAGAVSAVTWWRDFWPFVNKREVGQREANNKSCRSEHEGPHKHRTIRSHHTAGLEVCVELTTQQDKSTATRDELAANRELDEWDDVADHSVYRVVQGGCGSVYEFWCRAKKTVVRL